MATLLLMVLRPSASGQVGGAGPMNDCWHRGALLKFNINYCCHAAASLFLIMQKNARVHLHAYIDSHLMTDDMYVCMHA
jgi:hypothetical protein